VVLAGSEVVGLGDLHLRGSGQGEIGYGIHPRAWGRGLATATARELLRIVLEKSRARVITAGSVDEAFAVLKSARPAIILCDIGMPGKDGYDFIAELRRRKDDTPALAVTAFARVEDKIRALRAGYHGHITKPIEPAELLSTVAVLAKTKH